jgi:hypothetical protein
MARTAWKLGLALSVLSLLLFRAGARADALLMPAPTVSYYSPPPVVTYYSPPAVYALAPVTSYYHGPSVSYSIPAVSYFAAPVVTSYVAPSAVVTTTHYGLFGRPRRTTITYSPPVYVAR